MSKYTFEHPQSFKIGRITYNLPGMVREGEDSFLLEFHWGGGPWFARYVNQAEKDMLPDLFFEGDTFNQAVRGLHKKIKAHNESH